MNSSERLKSKYILGFLYILISVTQNSCNDKEKNLLNGNFANAAFYNPYENSILYFSSNNSVTYLIYDGYPRNDNLLMQQEYSCQINTNNNVYMPKLGMIQDLYLEITTTGNNIGLTNTRFGKGWIYQKDFSESLSK
jgi:outer membrane protein assembly factor BamA